MKWEVVDGIRVGRGNELIAIRDGDRADYVIWRRGVQWWANNYENGFSTPLPKNWSFERMHIDD